MVPLILTLQDSGTSNFEVVAAQVQGLGPEC